MWVITQRGFYSAVKYDVNKARHGGLPIHEDYEDDYLIVRSRVREDAEYLASKVDAQVYATPTGDYQYRVICKKDAFAEFLNDETFDIDYTNFKDRVTRVQGRDRHDTYMRVWGVLLDLARPSRRAYGRRSRDGWQPIGSLLEGDETWSETGRM